MNETNDPNPTDRPMTKAIRHLLLMIALGAAPVLATANDDCPPEDPPPDEPTEGREALPPVDLPVRPAPPLED